MSSAAGRLLQCGELLKKRRFAPESKVGTLVMRTRSIIFHELATLRTLREEGIGCDKVHPLAVGGIDNIC